jgi:hypothetical protein
MSSYIGKMFTFFAKGIEGLFSSIGYAYERSKKNALAGHVLSPTVITSIFVMSIFLFILGLIVMRRGARRLMAGISYIVCGLLILTICGAGFLMVYTQGDLFYKDPTKSTIPCNGTASNSTIFSSATSS